MFQIYRMEFSWFDFFMFEKSLKKLLSRFALHIMQQIKIISKSIQNGTGSEKVPNEAM